VNDKNKIEGKKPEKIPSLELKTGINKKEKY
jgi:hypothetical protein